MVRRHFCNLSGLALVISNKKGISKNDQELVSKTNKSSGDPSYRSCTLAHQITKLNKTMKVKQMKPSKALIAGAAIAGLLAGSSAVHTYAASTSFNTGVSLQTMDDAQKGKHACKGQNECKGQGGCKTADNDCKGKNSCKGKGGCATDESHASATPKTP
jgi:hypothetical protein